MTITGRPLHVNNGFASPSLKTVSASLDLVLLEVCENVCFPKAFFFRLKMDALMRGAEQESTTPVFTSLSQQCGHCPQGDCCCLWGKSLSNKDMLLIGGLNLCFLAICELVCVRYVWGSEQSKNQRGMYECGLDGREDFFSL